MSERPTSTGGGHTGVSRRQVLAGLGAVSGAGLLASLPGGAVVAGPSRPATGAAPAAFPQVLDAPSTTLTTLQLDAYAFHNAATNDPHPTRLVENLTGANPIPTPGTLVAPLPIPTGSVIRRIDLAYLGTPTIQLWRRPLADPRNEESLVNETLPMHTGSDPRAETTTVEITMPDAVAATLRIACPVGTSVFAAAVGYVPPVQGIVPIDPPTRPLDTRQPGPQQGKVQASEERVVDLDLPAGARGAVINVTITETETSFGFVSVYRNGIPWPGNSTINWSSPGLTAANAAITAVDASGRIVVRGGEAATHVIVDVVAILV